MTSPGLRNLLAGAALTGFALTLTPVPAWQAFGLGLLLPGGGFLLGSLWVFSAATLLLFAACVFAGRLTGNPLPALAVWLAAAAWAATHAASGYRCDLYELAGYRYAFDFWPMARITVPLLAAAAWCALALHARRRSRLTARVAHAAPAPTPAR